MVIYVFCTYYWSMLAKERSRCGAKNSSWGSHFWNLHIIARCVEPAKCLAILMSIGIRSRTATLINDLAERKLKLA